MQPSRFARLLGLLVLMNVPAHGVNMKVADMEGHRRVLLVAAASAADPALLEQLAIVRAWKGADERDVSLVRIAGDEVQGASDGAAALRRRYGLREAAFAAVLLGKDGHVALKSDSPVTADTLTATIDAMPMRRAGER